MKNSLRMPTFLGMAGLILFLILLNFISRRFIFGPRATADLIPDKVEVTNITDTSFTVSWETVKQSVGIVKIFSSEEKVFADSRDLQKGKSSSYNLHYVVANGLSSAQTYSFLIGSDGKFYGRDKKREGKKFSIKTAAIATTVPPESKLAYGRVIDAQNQPVEGILVYLRIPQIAPLSSLTDTQGYWVIPLSFAFNADLTIIADYREETINEEIVVDGGSQGRSLVTNFTRNNKPVPPIVLGKDADFRTLNGNGQAQEEESEGGYLPPVSGGVQPRREFKILNPEEGETIRTTKPEIFGVGPAATGLEITIESPVVFQAEVVVDQGGEWRWSPPQDLSLGKHQLTVKFKDRSGEEKTYTRNFTVQAAGGEAERESAFTASPSGQLRPSTIPTPTTRIALTVTPTLRLTPTSISTLTTTPTRVLTVTPSAVATQIPQTGSSLPLTTSLLTGGAVLLLGLFFFVFP